MNDTFLRQLDPAAPPKHELSERARADLESIVSTDLGQGALPTRRRPRGRVAGGLTMAAALAVAGILAPSALRSGDTAFASWTQTASALSATEEMQAAASCRHELSDADQAAGRADLALADRRGDWTTVVLSGDGGFSGLCITDASTGWFRENMIGSAGVASGLEPVGRRGVVATDLGSGTMAAGDISLAAGLAGLEVVGVTVRTESHGVVVATVSGGRFALWFPGAELDDRSTVPVEVAYADGSTAMVELEF